jgi:lambda repressor-like predicted transcriptional regulator
LKKALRLAVDAWLEKKGNSLLRLAKKSGVGYSTVRRMVQNEQEPCLKTQVLVGTVVLGPSNCLEMFKDEIPGLKAFHLVGCEKVADGSETREEFLSNSTSHAVISLAVRGTTREEIKEEYGRSGLEKLDSLLEDKVLRIEKDKIFAENFDLTTQGDICRSVQLSAEKFCPENYVSGSWWSDGFNAQGILALTNLCTEFNAKLEAINKSESLKGEYSSTIGMYMYRKGLKWL